ncbi:MAG: hypothetical protein AB7S77_10675 [Desulfatirhabdiaceae bacterium]
MKKPMSIRGMVVAVILTSTVLLSVSSFATGFSPLSGEGKQIWIGKDYYFTYGFNKKPQMGTIILRVELYDKNGKRDTSLKITGDSGMPSMAGHHDSGDIAFQLNNRGDYLLPVNVVMPGDWEVRLIFLKDGKPIFKGSIPFNV